LKFIANEISVPLGHIFNLSLTLGIFPEKLKKSCVVPIFKAGDPTSCNNYRPISLLSQLKKILEKIISVQLVNHLDRNNILYKHQYIFQRNKSTEHNLLQAFNFIGNAKFCVGVFFYLKKAFDVCSSDILLMKLEKIGIRGRALNWFTSYLTNRTQCVDIEGNFSSDKDIMTCIIQGSILGPILFLVYLNDLYLVSKSLTLMFADDTLALKGTVK
jgi:Reverse transcriptase (RNA-dependent DNA polymerase)